MNKKRSNDWQRWRKILGIVILVIVAILILIQVYFSFFAEQDLKQKIEAAISKSDNHLTANIGNLELTTLQRQLEVENITIRRDTAIQRDSASASSFSVDSLTVGNITINGFHIFSYVFNNKLVINDISINQPRLYATKASGPSQKSSKPDSVSLNAKVYNKVKSFTDALEIDEFSLNNFTASIRKADGDSSFIKADNFSVHLSDILIDSSWAREDSTMPLKAFSGSMDSLRLNVDPKLYAFKLQNLSFSSQDSSINADSLMLMPKLPKYKFSQSVGHQTDRIALKINNFYAKGFDLFALAEDQKLQASSLNIADANLDVFHSKKLPRGPKSRKTLYQVKFRQMDTPVKVDSVVVKNINIKYSEHKPDVPKPGYVTFENTNATIYNLDNTLPVDSTKKSIKMEAQSDVMGKGHLTASFNFPPNQTGTHYVSGRVGQLPITDLNPALKYLANVEIEDGMIHSLNFKMELGPVKSNGIVKLHYTNLKIKIIKFNEKNEADGKWLKSFIANKIVMKENNTPPLREAEVSFERIQDKSIFNYWWKSLLTGLKSSIK